MFENEHGMIALRLHHEFPDRSPLPRYSAMLVPGNHCRPYTVNKWSEAHFSGERSCVHPQEVATKVSEVALQAPRFHFAAPPVTRSYLSGRRVACIRTCEGRNSRSERIRAEPARAKQCENIHN